MNKKINIKPPIWPKELTFEEFRKLNPLLNENELIPLYNQYLNKFLTELAERKVHFKQSLNKNLQLEINKFQKKYNQTLLDTELEYPNINYDDPRGGRYPKGKKAVGRIDFLFHSTLWVIEGNPQANQNALINRTAVLRATDGTSHTFGTGPANEYSSYLSFVTGLQEEINNHPLFTAQLDVFGALSGNVSNKRLVGIIITQNVPGSAGNTVIGGTLFPSELASKIDFTGGDDTTFS